MPWLDILKGLLTLASAFASWLHDKQLIDAGALQETLQGLRSAQDAIVRAKAARDAVADDPISVLNDSANRDNDAKPSQPPVP